MSTSYFIGPFDPMLWKDGKPDPMPESDLRIDPETYARKLLERWPNANGAFSETEGGWWSLDEPGRPGLDVTLQANLQHVSFRPGANFTDFILWHRQIIPSQYPLFLSDSTSLHRLQLSVNTTREEIQAFTQIYEL